MNNNKKANDAVDNDELTPEQARRQFIKKYGKLAAVTPLAVTALMTPKTSAAPKSCRPNQQNKHCPPESNGF
ncbi:hypothetical protein [Thalassotalea mangrovi]|uniref:Uncharacterized protein n=1 Tax=Thalassotalea mangrovi TaxID=2572245 RepID=A0A4V5NW15_9GAMM|nr:hypothetical protein [Thalassotalea mangrovi]TKB44661.1 hypothetical protein E8M12_11020 [Thalassotalea mangrovi]